MMIRLAAAGLTVALLGAACAGPNPDASSKGKVEETTTTTIAKGPETTASQLRSRLTGLLQAHVYLAGAAAASQGRPDEASAAQAALDKNSEALIANMTAIFTGDDADVAKQFGELWKGGVGQNAGSLGTLFGSALSVPADTVSGPLNAAGQAIGNGTNFTALRAGAAQMGTLAATLTAAIAKKHPERVAGDPSSKGAELLTGLNGGLREHVFLASAATGAALGGRNDEFSGAKAALDANSDAITSIIGGVYGADAGTQFAPLWKKHIDLLVDYTSGVAAKDQARADKAMDDLLAYTEDFGAFISAASPKLAKDAVAELVKTHLFTLKDVIDAQGEKNFVKADGNELTAADHMAMIASSLATTVVAQFPDKF
jgi:hypothetical protein